MNLRARVLVGAGVIAVVLAIGAVATTRTTRSHLLDQVDAQLEAAGNPARAIFGGGRPGGGPQERGPDRLSTFYVGYVVEETVQTLDLPSTARGLAEPVIDVADVVESVETGEPVTVGSTDGDLRYRVLASVGPFGEEVFVLGLPLTDVDAAVDRLVVVEGVATAAVLGVVALVAWWVVHLGVRPLKRMTATATAIAAGDLSARVPPAPTDTETAELGDALNHMLGRIEESMDRQRRFAADASHELRTPVTTIRGYAELYRAGGLPAGPDLDEAMRRTEQEAVRMGGLIEDLLRLARLDQRRPLAAEPVDLVAVASDAARDARAVAPDRDIALDVPDEPVVVTGDEDRLRQVVANVVGNALVHTEEGVAVSIAVSRIGGDRVRLSVADRGAGMPPEVAARVFERFYRADPSRSRHRGGSGLGLSIVEATVAAHGGSVSVTSAPGEGTTVEIELVARTN